MKVSLTGLLRRMEGRQDQKFAIEEFIENYKKAKGAYKIGRLDELCQFFDLYVTDSD
jgi:hypothetical protein